jgi:hypothetical protein
MDMINIGGLMKTLMTVIVLVLVTFTASAETSVEVLGPVAMTYHPVVGSGGCSQFANKLSKSGCLIANNEYGLVLSQESDGKYQSAVFFMGNDSVGSEMEGGLYERGYEYGGLQLGLALGVYFQGDQEYYNRGLIPFEIGSVNGIGIVPVLAIAVNYKIDLSKHTFLKLNNILSPVMTNSVLSIGWRF